MDTSRQNLFDQLAKFEKTMLRLKRHTLSKLGITLSQAELLMTVSETSRVTDIAETLHVSSSAATQLIESAETKGLLGRQRSESDKRAVEVTLTPKGRATLEELTRIKCNLAKELVHELTDDEVKQLATIHKKIIACARKHLDPLRHTSETAIINEDT